MALYELEDVRLSLGGAEVLDIPELAIEAGERIALVGPNGSGKTSLLKVLAALLAPSSGILRFDGRPIRATRLSSRARSLSGRVAYLHQQPYILAGSVSYNVEFGSRSRGTRAGPAADRAARAMRLLGLEGFGRRGHRELSGGEAQRVALARAICSGGEVLLLDEPTASADSASRELIAAAIAAAADSGSTIVLATHDDGLVAALGASRLCIAGGRIAGDLLTREAAT